MNAIRHIQDEAYWELIAQILKPFTPKLQLALIEHLGSFRQIFEGREELDQPVLNQQLQIARKAYTQASGRIRPRK